MNNTIGYIKHYESSEEGLNKALTDIEKHIENKCLQSKVV